MVGEIDMHSTAFSNRLAELVSLSGKSANQIERELGYPRNALNNYRMGKCPSAKRLFQLARYFEIDPEYLFGETEAHPVKDISFLFERLTSDQKQELFVLTLQWMNEQNNNSKSYIL